MAICMVWNIKVPVNSCGVQSSGHSIRHSLGDCTRVIRQSNNGDALMHAHPAEVLQPLHQASQR